jgi:hypothetical protein
MVINSFVKWLLEQGHHVVQTESTCWYDIGPRIYQAFPYHQLVNPSRAELLQLFRNEKAIGLRYSTLVSEKYGKLSYHVINTNKDYSLDHLSKKARYSMLPLNRSP